MDGYNRNGHSKNSLKVHLIFVTKYRKKIFAHPRRKEAVKQFLYDAAIRHSYRILQMETDKDHIHVLLEYPPNVAVSEVVRQLKQYSTYKMWNLHGEYLSHMYWKRKALWSDGYFACSIGQVSQTVIEKYIQNQG